MGNVFGTGTLVGHRGLGQGIVDGQRGNTLGSFLAAIEAGVDWVEVDVRRSADDALFVVHDEAFDDGAFLATLPADEAARRGALPLTQLLEELPEETGVAFDVKSSVRDAERSANLTTAALLGDLCNRMLGGRPAVAQSFDPAALQHLRQTVPSLALGLLTWIRFPIGVAVAAAAHLDVQTLAIHSGSLSKGLKSGPLDVPELPELVDSVHAADRELVVWCPPVRRVRALAAAGVDAMVVDDVSRHAAEMARVPGGSPHR
ncbi:MAG: glycerophosphodiester phosphodiesterase [Nocardioides sp.]